MQYEYYMDEVPAEKLTMTMLNIILEGKEMVAHLKFGQKHILIYKDKQK